MTNDPSNFSMKELITQFVIPRLDKIDQKLDSKADQSEIAELDKRITYIENATLRPESVKQIVSDVLNDASARGWSRKEQVFGIIGVLIVGGSFVLSLLTFIFR